MDGHVVKVGLNEKKAKLERIWKLEDDEIFMTRKQAQENYTAMYYFMKNDLLCIIFSNYALLKMLSKKNF